MSSSSIYGTGAAAPISFSGVASGVNTSAIIQALAQGESGIETQLQNQETTANSQLTEWQTINGSLTGLQSIASSLADPSAFNATQASIDQTNVATVTAAAGAVAGTHTLTVNALASAQRVLSGSFTDPTIPLGITGSFTLDGKAISLTASDTLNSLAAQINGAGAGVAASVIDAGDGNYQLSLAASSTGAVNAISAADVAGGTALEQLGLVPSSGTLGLRQTVATSGGNGGAGSIAYANSSQPIATLDGATGNAMPSGAVTIDGTSVSLDLNTMSLTDIANAINGAGIAGVQAQVVALPGASGAVTPSSPKQLQIVSTNGTPLTSASFTDPNGVLSALGVTQTGFANQVSGAADAQFTLDGVSYTNASNTVTSALPNVSIGLLATNDSSSSSPANISITADTSSLTTTVNNFVTAYNGVIDAINGQLTYSGSTQAGAGAQSTPPLFGNMTLENIHSQLQGILDATNGSASLASVGISVSSTGDLSVDPTTLQNALSANPQQVAGLFSTVGSATGADLSYVASGSAQPTNGQGYAVNITQAATQASLTATSAFQTLTQPETLTFSGGLFGSANTAITLPTGSTLQNAIALINGNANLNQFLYASQGAGGALSLTSIGYGSAQSFSVSSNLASGGSGIGSTALSAAGKDVKGTIDGEAATGDGQSLIGNTGDSNAAGLQVTYSGMATGNVGSVSVAQGLAAQLGAVLSAATDTTTGSVTAAESAINTQITTLQGQITQQQTLVSNYEQQLQAEFSSMEETVSALKSQQAAFDAEAGIATAGSSSTSGTGSSTGTTGSGSSSSGGLGNSSTGSSGGL